MVSHASSHAAGLVIPCEHEHSAGQLVIEASDILVSVRHLLAQHGLNHAPKSNRPGPTGTDLIHADGWRLVPNGPLC